MKKIVPIIMCGGSGTRLWPLSRRLEPKQFQKLTGGHSLFHQTLERFYDECFDPAIVLVNAAHNPRLQRELEQISLPEADVQIIIEPSIRSTAPAIAAAALILAEKNPETIMLVVPSDHQIGEPKRLSDAYQDALPFVEANNITLFGIEPTAPETGFGYIRAGAPLGNGVHKVEAFIEKPNIERACELVADPRHTWNSGIFLFKASTIINELARFSPLVLEQARIAVDGARLEGNTVFLGSSYSDAPEISIDHAVMEHSSRLGVIPVAPSWSDLGSFEALWEIGEQNSDENVLMGENILKDVRRSYIRGGRRLISIVGLSNIVVVDTDDAILIASRAQAQNVKLIAQELTENHHPAADVHSSRLHEGGSLRTIESNKGFRLEQVSILPGREMIISTEDHVGYRVLTLISGELSIKAANETTWISTGESHSYQNSVPATFRNYQDTPAQALLATIFTHQTVGNGAPTNQNWMC
jgi:mannose-1-phosphate guanylyltransferase/mannose-6-phosphate isomerase